ncbi:MAG: deoxyribonuclease IV [Candidatus Babeliaceae bacterium]|nr:deoxyribonuclease IV [Candidatus Babeliaceae bacterium]
MNKSTLLLGAHLSTAGGLHRSIKTAQELNCTAIQIFTHSNRQWAFKLPLLDAVEEFIAAKNNSTVKTIIVHASYLMNPASPDKDSRNRAVKMLKMELQTCSILEIPYLVLHPGSRLESATKVALSNCADSINYSLEKNEGAKILIENMAGQGSTIGSKLEELQEIYYHIEQKERVGFCFDTCHAFAAGYIFTTEESYGSFWKEFDTLLDIRKLHAIHINDSLKPLGSNVDRHAHIGKGRIDLKAFELIMNDERFNNTAKILETPKGQGLEEDSMNLSKLISLIK